MAKLTRKIIEINEDLCNGCGECVTSCAEGAIEIIDGKAKLVSETFCDGLGACIGDCPTGALTIEERPAEEFDEAAVAERMHQIEDEKKIESIVRDAMGPKNGGGCPGSMSRAFDRAEAPSTDDPSPVPSRLANWPVQLMLAPVSAPYFAGTHLLVSADCVPYAHGNFHGEFLQGKTVVVGCPKLDDTGHYQEKLTQILRNNDIKSVEVLFMEVPCCFGMANMVQKAAADAGRLIPLTYTKIGVKGDVLERNTEA